MCHDHAVAQAVENGPTAMESDTACDMRADGDDNVRPGLDHSMIAVMRLCSRNRQARRISFIRDTASAQMN